VKVGSLFSGYGGLDMAVGGDLAWYSEIEPAACKVLEQLHPDVPNIGDITAVDWSQVEPVDVITGGYPCQPFSHAGKRKGTNDERHLWPYVRDAISAIRPRYAILENVRGHLTLGFADVLADLASMGWDARWGVVRASDAGAPHGRARLFIVAYPDGSRWQKQRRPIATQSQHIATKHTGDVFTDAAGKRLQHASIGVVARSRQVTTQGHQPTATDANSDGHGQQLHARGVGGVEGQTKSSPQQRQRTRRESDSRGSQPDRNTNGIYVSPQQAGDWQRPESSGTGCDDQHGSTAWGPYEPAIYRWQNTIGRLAPAPTIRRGERDRLNPVFVEWMMGLPEGHVTGHGLSAAQELKMLGNGVVPQQAALALRLLGVR